ncbi:AraC family transcriptional regulator [Paremcibacter congregatus]|uniref:AraC family transcriptional regulator n=1 Tax=Paremcibacter congregatus TaxID=2043170 RepID=UPI0030EBE891|tara:strand:+ start:1340 stop:2320 length:981 start_codon:yes stop_codon:yes gene_type:complete
MVQKPLEKFQLFHTYEADEARQIVSNVYCDHTLTPDHRGRVDALHNRAKLSSVSLNYMEYGSDVTVDPGYLENFFLFQLPVDGAARICVNNDEFDSAPGVSSAINPSEYTRMRWNKDCKKLLVQIKREAMEERLSRLLMRPIDKPILFDHRVSADQNAQAQVWWRQIWFLINELDQDMNPWRSHFLLEDLERNLLTSLLFSFQHNYQAQLNAREATAAPKHVRRAEDYIMAHLKDTISIDDLVAVTGVSPRSIYNGFNSFRGTTPMKYILEMRLAKVREDLQAAAPGANVTTIATRWGFNQLGRFAVSYKKVYGESPSETLKNNIH